MSIVFQFTNKGMREPPPHPSPPLVAPFTCSNNIKTHFLLRCSNHHCAKKYRQRVSYTSASACNFIKKENLAQAFFCGLSENFKDTYFRPIC